MSANGQIPRIAWFSPLNLDGDREENGSVSAYVTDLLLPAIRAEFKVDLFCDREGTYKGEEIFNYLSCFSRHKLNPYDLIFYQYEDSKAANFVRLHLGLMPGIVLFHDLLIKEELPPPLTFSTWPEILEIFSGLRKEWPVRYPQPDRGPVAYREVSLAPISLFSSPRQCGESRRLIEHSLAENIKFSLPKKLFLPLPVISSDPSPVKESPAEKVTIAFCGGAAIEYRPHIVLRAFKEFAAHLQSHGQESQLLWLVNERESGEASDLIAEFELANCKLVLGRSPSKWSTLVREADIAIHTLFSVYGSLGPYFPISLSYGIPSVVTNFADSEYLPDDIVFKIEPGSQETSLLTQTLKEICKLSVDQKDNLADALKSYVNENHDQSSIAFQLIKVFKESLPFLKEVSTVWSEIEARAKESVTGNNLTRLNDVCSVFGSDSAPTTEVQSIFSELGWMGKGEKL